MAEKYSAGVAQFLPTNIDLLVRGLDEYIDHLSILTVQGLRNPAVGPGLEKADLAIRSRLNRCRAFGRDIDRSPSEQDVSQYGLYGTAAAIEILSHAKEGEHFRRGRMDLLNPQAREWARTLLMLWNFLGFAVDDLSNLPASKWWKQRRTTLRICNMLRALASLREPLKALAEHRQEFILSPDNPLGDDLNKILPNEYLANVAKELFSSLKSAYTPYNRTPATYKLRFESSNVSEAFAFSFATDTTSLPGTWNEWLFLTSSVLVAVIRCFSAGLLTSNETAEIFKVSSIDRMRHVLKNAQALDQRVRLFALYSLLQLASDGDETKVPSHLLLSDRQKQWLLREVGITLKIVLRDSVAIIDSHIPYEIRFRRRGQTEYHDDYFVVPVVPIMLILLATIKPSWLFRPRIKGLVNSWVEVAQTNRKHNLEVPAIIPYQLGEYNGTVNAVYYREAASHLIRAFKKRRRFGLLLALSGYIATNWRSFLTAISGVILLVIAYLLQAKGSPSDELLGAGLTLILSWLARSIYDVVKKFWMG